MWDRNNTNEIEGVVVESSSILPEEPVILDESSYLTIFSVYNPNSPMYSNNETDVGMMKFSVEGVALTFVATMGILGNIASITVLSSPRMKNSSNCFLLCMAVCDILTLIGSVLLIGIPSLLMYNNTESKNPYSEEEGLFMYNIRIANYASVMPATELYAMSVSAICASIHLTMALTLERYLAICRPLFARYLCTWSRAGFVSSLVIIFNILYNLPRWWEYTYVIETYKNFTVYRPIPTSLRMQSVYDTYYIHISYVLLEFVIPVCFLITFNVLIYRGIRQSNKLRRRLSSCSSSTKQKHENSLTRVLFGVVAVFLICQLSPAVHAVYRYADGSRDYMPEVESLWIFMVILNSSVNFLIYCTSGSKFREVFCEKYCFWRKGKSNQLSARDRHTFRTKLSNSSSQSRSHSGRRLSHAHVHSLSKKCSTTGLNVENGNDLQTTGNPPKDTV